MEWGGCEQYLCLLAVGLKGQAQGKKCCHPSLKYLGVKRERKGIQGELLPHGHGRLCTYVMVCLFPRQREFSFLLGWRQYRLQN